MNTMINETLKPSTYEVDIMTGEQVNDELREFVFEMKESFFKYLIEKSKKNILSVKDKFIAKNYADLWLKVYNYMLNNFYYDIFEINYEYIKCSWNNCGSKPTEEQLINIVYELIVVHLLNNEKDFWLDEIYPETYIEKNKESKERYIMSCNER